MVPSHIAQLVVLTVDLENLKKKQSLFFLTNSYSNETYNYIFKYFAKFFSQKKLKLN